MEEYDATYDSDDEVDFSKMDMVREMLVSFPDPPPKRKGGSGSKQTYRSLRRLASEN